MTEMSSEDLATVLANRLDATLDERLDQRLDRMDDRLARMQDSLRLAMREEVRRTMEDERRANPAPANVVVPTPTEVEPERRPNRVDPVTGPRLTTYSGFTVNEAGQVLLGARFDAGPLSWQSPGLRFVPELALGFGSGGQSTMLVANGLYRFAGLQLGTLPTLTPHVLAGLGLLNFSDRVGTRDGLEATVNLGYGVSFPLGTWTFAGQRPLLQVEHQGVEFFDLNRLLIGLRWGGR